MLDADSQLICSVNDPGDIVPSVTSARATRSSSLLFLDTILSSMSAEVGISIRIHGD